MRLRPRGADFFFVLLFALGSLAAACVPGPADDTPVTERRVRVVATTSIVADLVREVGGDRVQVTGLMGPGVDPHLYRASEGDVGRMADADIVFYNGLHLEGRMAEVFERVGEAGGHVIAVAESIDEARLLSPAEFEGAYDPHVWMDVSLWSLATVAVAAGLGRVDPGSAVEYGSGAEAYRARLVELDAYVRDRSAELPEAGRVLVTAHDAFNYFGAAYGFEVRGLQGISTVTEAGTADVQGLAAFVADRRIPALFVETSVSPRSIEAVRAAVRARGFEVRTGGDLYSDALGGEGSGATTYIDMIRHNVDTIVTGLGGGG